MNYDPDGYAPLPGDIGLTRISGYAGRLIRLGQWLNKDGFQDFEHAFIYVGDGSIIEAEPGGARLVPLTYPDVWWCTGIAAKRLRSPAFRPAIVHNALALKGTPYSEADYFALAAKRLHIPAPQLNHYVRSSGHMICSQLAAFAWCAAGTPVYAGQRWTGNVTPGDLYKLDRQLRSQK